MLVVIPGEIKSSNATFLQKFTANNIADFGELELSNANFQVLERSNLGPVLRGVRARVQPGRPAGGAQVPGHGQAQEHEVHRQVRHPEDGAGGLRAAELRRHARSDRWRACWAPSAARAAARAAGAVGGTALGSVHSGEATSVWVIGMRYKIINAETTEQLAQGYTEEKMEVGATSGGALGVNSSQQGGAGLDTMVQRLVQKSVWEIDSKYK